MTSRSLTITALQDAATPSLVAPPSELARSMGSPRARLDQAKISRYERSVSPGRDDRTLVGNSR